MPTYTKETALYDTGAIQSGIDGAAQTATDYITAITGGGIMVHPSGDNTSGWRIADALQLLKSSIVAFSVSLVSGMAKVVVGESSKSHAEIDYNSLQLVDKDGDTYFHVSDLRGEDGVAEITDTFIGDGFGGFNLSLRAESTDYTVTVDGVEVTSGVEKGHNVVMFDTAPAEGSVIVVTYDAISSQAKAYTAGLRRSSGSVGPMSFAEGAYVMARGYASHAEGHLTDARGWVSHAEGTSSVASGVDAHAEGYGSTASGYASHAEGGETVASFNYTHAQNLGTIASSEAQTAIGKYNDDNASMAFIIGNGTSNSDRSNAFWVDWSGEVGMSNLELQGNANSNGGWIDFHYNKSTADYTSRITEDASGRLSIFAEIRPVSKNIMLHSTSVDRDGANPSSTTYGNAGIEFHDQQYESVGLVKTRRETNGAMSLCLISIGESNSGADVYNALIIRANRDGSATYSCTNAANFRAAIGAAASSDRRLKTDLKPLGDDAVEFVRALKSYSYLINGERQVGLIAQDVHEADKWGTRMTFETEDGVDGLDDWERLGDGIPTWKLDYIRLLPPTITALQKAMERIDVLEQKIADLEGRI